MQATISFCRTFRTESNRIPSTQKFESFTVNKKRHINFFLNTYKTGSKTHVKAKNSQNNLT
jgi:hypothetical protein